MKSQLKLEIRPNNQLTLTVGSWSKPKQDAYKSAVMTNDETRLETRNYAAKIKTSKNLADMDRAKNKYRQEIGIKPSKPLLDIILKSQRAKTPPLYTGNTPKSFTRQSGQKLRECGAAIDIASQGNLESCREVTLTLPADTEMAFKVLADRSSYVINRLFQPIRNKYGDTCHWFFVWEYQKRGALHTHICIYHNDPFICEVIANKLISSWHNILCDLSDITGVCMFSRKNQKSCTVRSSHQHHTAPIKKAVGSYFSKYAGKQESKQSWYCQKYPVSRFWGSSKAVKRIIKENSLRFDLDLFREQECQSKFERIVENILEKVQIVSSTSYDFDIQLSGKARINKAKNGSVYVVSEQGKNVASGTRYTFYVCPEDFRKAMDLVVNEFSTF